MPISRAPMMAPARTSVSPRAMSDPAWEMNCPGRAARRISMASDPRGCVCSIMITASAPRGSGPPVAMDVAVPRVTRIWGVTPQAISSPLSARRTGVVSLALATSATRRQKPSTLERSKGGTSMGATMSRATVRPRDSWSGSVSWRRGRGNSAASKRAIASSRERIDRNCSWDWAPDCSLMARPLHREGGRRPPARRLHGLRSPH